MELFLWLVVLVVAAGSVLGLIGLGGWPRRRPAALSPPTSGVQTG